MRSFLGAAQQLERERLSVLLTVHAVAAQGDSNAIKRLRRELERGDST